MFCFAQKRAREATARPGFGVAGQQASPRSYEDHQAQLKKRKLMRRIAMPDQFKVSFKRGLELGPANNLREQLALFTMAPPHLAHRAALSRGRIGRGGRLIFDRVRKFD